MARIAAGLLKGLTLDTPRRIRATEAKVRQALFNILGTSVAGARVIDGFAGSGVLGIEALSRGAGLVVFLESDAACLRIIQRNLARIPPGVIRGRWNVVRGDALRTLRALAAQSERFDLIVLDPPYEGMWGGKALNVVAECGMLSPAGLVCLEHARQSEPPLAVGRLAVVKQRRYGDTALSFYQSRHAQTSA
jgi:16S rRNA (guanine966-N2)-methyltransferase